jgi:hypothetical protein
LAAICCLRSGFELFGGAEAAVGGAVGEEDLGVLAVDFGAFGLAVGAVGAADVGAFVPGEAEPAEGVEDHLLGGGDEAGAVGVFDAEDELAAALAGVDVVEQADVGGAYVGVAGGGGSDADPAATGLIVPSSTAPASPEPAAAGHSPAYECGPETPPLAQSPPPAPGRSAAKDHASASPLRREEPYTGTSSPR